MPSHVIIFEDTWVSGGHVRSVAAALNAAGAEYVVSLSMARWLDPARGNTVDVMAQLTVPFDPDICPYTGEHC